MYRDAFNFGILTLYLQNLINSIILTIYDSFMGFLHTIISKKSNKLSLYFSTNVLHLYHGPLNPAYTRLEKLWAKYVCLNIALIL